MRRLAPAQNHDPGGRAGIGQRRDPISFPPFHDSVIAAGKPASWQLAEGVLVTFSGR
jgi:hypothetical protein